MRARRIAAAPLTAILLITAAPAAPAQAVPTAPVQAGAMSTASAQAEVTRTASAEGAGQADIDFTRPELVAGGLQIPWGLAFLPDGSALVSERNTARIVQVRPGATPVEVARVPGVSPAGEGGLLGIAVSPSYAQDGYVYAYFTAAADNRIVRFTLAAPGTPQVIRSGIPKSSIHNGGRLAFGPDGMLYASTGDANVSGNSQNPQSLGGKILRMRPDGSVPPDNPTAGSLVYSLGHRNVQGLAWDARGLMYATEFGQNTWDEVNHIVAGGNYGWPVVEGRGSDPRYRNPIVVWTTAESSPSGAAVAGDTLFAAALRGTRLWRVPLDGQGGAGTPDAVLQNAYGRLRHVALAPDGHLWIMTSNRDGRGTPGPQDDRVVRFPPAGGDPGETVFADDFETDKGWTVNPAGTDTATAGRWERGDPDPTTYNGVPLQLGSTVSGTNDLVTGRAGGGPGDADVDGGLTTIRSPQIALPAGTSLTLSFSYYLAHLNNAGSTDYLRVRAGTTVLFQRLGSAANTGAAWQRATADLSAFAGQTVRLEIQAADAGTGSLIEAAVDDVTITRNQPTS
ncbi:oxidoreductase [Nonomuraea sp. NN258]|uniref:PQQ-dependent sugar dehydrogenase n=1 Tax=Nonomuraea antri TaxID=2730852 RepID=UPI0015690A7B|nr:PQQ-dependent sugar dehydrogenase [Nonomuraea antri]NRQ40044.1 oxidoreductase [Nonomuraea antri]